MRARCTGATIVGGRERREEAARARHGPWSWRALHDPVFRWRSMRKAACNGLRCKHVSLLGGNVCLTRVAGPRDRSRCLQLSGIHSRNGPSALAHACTFYVTDEPPSRRRRFARRPGRSCVGGGSEQPVPREIARHGAKEGSSLGTGYSEGGNHIAVQSLDSCRVHSRVGTRCQPLTVVHSVSESSREYLSVCPIPFHDSHGWVTSGVLSAATR